MGNGLVVKDKEISRLPGVRPAPPPLRLPDRIQLHLGELPAVSMPGVRGGELWIFYGGVGKVKVVGAVGDRGLVAPNLLPCGWVVAHGRH